MKDPCREVLSDLQRFLDQECPGDMEAVIARHLAACPPCLDRADFERELRAIVAAKCRDRAPVGLVQRITLRLDIA